MCGLIFVKRFDGKPAAKMATKRYRKQKSRGSQGFGYVSLNEGAIVDYWRATTEKDIVELLEKDKSTEVFFHHRYPTSTGNFSEAAHPIYVSHEGLKYDYYVMHNGVIQNDTELKTKHQKLGFEYTTEITVKSEHAGQVISSYTQFNDSEALAIELAMSLDVNGEGVSDVRGSIAFMVIQVDKQTRKAVKLYFGRNGGNPLKVNYERKDFYMSITSEGEGVDAKVHTLYALDYKDNTITERPFTVGSWTAYASTGHRSRYGFDTIGNLIDKHRGRDEDDFDIDNFLANQPKQTSAEVEEEATGSKGKTLATVAGKVARPISDILDEMDYYEKTDEYNTIQGMLDSADNDMDEFTREYLEDTMIELEEKLSEYEYRNGRSLS